MNEVQLLNFPDFAIKLITSFYYSWLHLANNKWTLECKAWTEELIRSFFCIKMLPAEQGKFEYTFFSEREVN